MGGAFSPRRFGRSEENCFGGRNWCVEAMDLADIKKVYLADVKKQEPDVELPTQPSGSKEEIIKWIIEWGKENDQTPFSRHEEE